MLTLAVSEGVQAAMVTAVGGIIGGIIISLISKFTKQNAKDHSIVTAKLDKLSDKIGDTHTAVTEVKVDVKYLREDQYRLEDRFNKHLED